MNNIQPWCISRQLWWGHRIPAWYSKDNKIFVAETEIEAKKKAYKIYKKKNNCILEIFSKMQFLKKEIGSSISCSGACLTVEKFNKNLITFYVSKETLNKTFFKSFKDTQS